MAAPDGAPEVAAPRKRLPVPRSGSCVEPFFRRLWWLLVFGYVSSESPGRLPDAWRLPEPSQSCSSWNMTPGSCPQSQGVVSLTSLVQCWLLAVAQVVLEFKLGRVRFWKVFFVVCGFAGQLFYSFSWLYNAPTWSEFRSQGRKQCGVTEVTIYVLMEDNRH